jgi:two-component system, NarL family, nitrate/nitrite response regulator NarL
MESGSGEESWPHLGRTPGDPRTRDPRPLRVLLVDDHGFYRAGLRSMLSAEGLEVSEARSGEAAVELVAATAPDVVLMDLHMPGMSGIEATRRLGEIAAVPVVMLTVSADDRDVVEAVRAGARGYLLKDAAIEEIVASVRAAAGGDAWISPRVTSALLAYMRETGAVPPDERPAAELSKRERDVLRLIAAGKDNAAIGRELYISAGTVRKVVSSILAKLEVDSRVEAAVYAVRRGLA